MNITFAWEVGRGWGGGRGRATSTSVKFDLFLFYMNSKHIMKLKITRKKTYNEVKNYQEEATITSTSLVMVPKEEVRKKLTRGNRTMISIQETSVSLTFLSSD